MLMTRADCRTCHRTQEVSATGTVLWKGSAEACLMCHAASEVQKLQSYHEALRKALPDIEAALQAARKALPSAKLPPDRTTTLAKDLDRIQFDLEFLRKANDIHNSHYAGKLTRVLAEQISKLCGELKAPEPKIVLPLVEKPKQ
jgi:hypothetical protein